VVTLNALEEYLQQEYGNDIPAQKINVFLKVDGGYQ
jgi:hypothetical protein